MTRAVRVDVKNIPAFLRRGDLWFYKREYDKAIADYGEVIRLDPQGVYAYDRRAECWRAKGDDDKVIADLNDLIRLNPTDVTYFDRRGFAWQKKGDYDAAIVDFNQAIRLAPQFAEAYNGRAWLWATCPDARVRDGKRAIESAAKACELTQWKSYAQIDTLAAACAEAGRLRGGGQVAVEGDRIAQRRSRQGQLPRRRLNLYQAKKPYRESKP